MTTGMHFNSHLQTLLGFPDNSDAETLRERETILESLSGPKAIPVSSAGSSQSASLPLSPNLMHRWKLTASSHTIQFLSMTFPQHHQRYDDHKTDPKG